MLQAVRLYTTAGILSREESLSVTQIHLCDPFSCFDLSLLLRPACWRSPTVGQSTGVTSCQSDDRAIRRPNDLIFTDAL